MIRSLGAFLLLLFIMETDVTAQSANRATITPAETHALLGRDSTHLFLDVRTQGEFDGPSGRVPGSMLIPVQDLEARMAELEPYRGRTIIVICRSGNRSGFATAMLREQGYTALNMVGGMIRWNAEQLRAEHTEQ